MHVYSQTVTVTVILVLYSANDWLRARDCARARAPVCGSVRPEQLRHPFRPGVSPHWHSELKPDCGREFHVSFFPWWVPTPCLDSIVSTFRLRWITGFISACLAVTCRLHVWQNDCSLLRATALTRRYNGHGNKSWLWRGKFSVPPLLLSGWTESASFHHDSAGYLTNELHHHPSSLLHNIIYLSLTHLHRPRCRCLFCVHYWWHDCLLQPVLCLLLSGTSCSLSITVTAWSLPFAICNSMLLSVAVCQSVLCHLLSVTACFLSITVCHRLISVLCHL